MLLLDVGNSAVKAAWSDGERLIATERYRIRGPNDAEEAARDIASRDVPADILFMSVNPSISDGLMKNLKTRCSEIQEVGRDIPLGVRVKTDEPERVGADRTTTCLAAYEACRGPLIVVDFGTAITFDCVGDDGAFLGGVICPGISMMASSLEHDTAFLPVVEVSASAAFMARNTKEAMISGIYHGAVEMTRGIIRGLRTELGSRIPAVATGGDAEMIAPQCPEIAEVRKDLSLVGLLILYKRSHD